MLNGQQTTFELDTGAELTAISPTVYSEKQHGILTRAAMPLCGPSNNPLKVRGQFNGTLTFKERTTTQPVFVIDRLATSLLGLPAIKALQLLRQVDGVQELSADFRSQYPNVFTGLGRLEG